MHINIFVNSTYAYHVAFFAELLKLDYDVITTTPLDFSKYQAYYNKMIGVLYEETKTYFETSFFEYYMKNKLRIRETIQKPGKNINIPNTTFIYDYPKQGLYYNIAPHNLLFKNTGVENAELHFCKALDTNNIIPDLHKYFTDRNANRRIIKSTIERYLNRTPTNIEVEKQHYHSGYNDKWIDYVPPPRRRNACCGYCCGGFYYDRIDLFSWLMILHFCQEGRNLGLHTKYVAAGRDAPGTRVAVLLSGYSRNFKKFRESHKKFIDNPYINTFIHTWDRRGPRYEFYTEAADIEGIRETYLPRTIEHEECDTHSLSLINTYDKVLLKNIQQHDDATRYIMPDFLSLKKTYDMMIEYENQNNMVHVGIIKLSFDIDIKEFDFKHIYKDMCKDTLYMAKGCRQCDYEYAWPQAYPDKRHNGHYTDLSFEWFYGNRSTAGRACQIYSHVPDIINMSYDENTYHNQYRKLVYFSKEFEDVSCFFPPRLLRTLMKENRCQSSSNIKALIEIPYNVPYQSKWFTYYWTLENQD